MGKLYHGGISWFGLGGLFYLVNTVMLFTIFLLHINFRFFIIMNTLI